jgi:hypothetical protein
MPLVVFLRGANVGGHKAFSPSALAKKLSHLDIVNIGAAGTFVVRANVSQALLRKEILSGLPFVSEMMIATAKELHLAADSRFAAMSPGKDITTYVSVLAKRPAALPKLPIAQPPGKDWQVKLLAGVGRIVISHHRRAGRRLIYPNEVVEKHFGGPATTRNWSTIERIVALLRA